MVVVKKCNLKGFGFIVLFGEKTEQKLKRNSKGYMWGPKSGMY